MNQLTQIDTYLSERIKRAAEDDQHGAMIAFMDTQTYVRSLMREKESIEHAAYDTNLQLGRVLHRIVRGMHDGSCGQCGHIGDDKTFKWPDRYECPECSFVVTYDEAKLAMQQFLPHTQKCVEIFRQWRTTLLTKS